MRFLSLSFCFFYLLSFVASNVMADNTPIRPEGKGSKDEPFLICRIENLVWLGGNVEKLTNCYFRMTADIDASETEDWNDGKGFEPIGTAALRMKYGNEKGYEYLKPPSLYNLKVTPFQGHFDGNGHVIDGLKIKQSNCAYGALFGAVGRLNDMSRFERVDFMSRTNMLFWTNVKKEVDDSISCRSSIRNLVLKNLRVSNSECVAGLVGAAINADIADCHVQGALAAERCVCGLASIVYGCDVQRCSVNAEIDVKDADLYGLGTIVSLSKVYDFNCGGSFRTAKDFNGHIHGLLYVANRTEFLRCLVTLKHHGGDLRRVDGLVNINATNFYNQCVFKDCYYCKEFMKDDDGIGMKSNAALKKQETFKGWDFANVWDIEEGNSFPILRLPKPSGESSGKTGTGRVQKKTDKSAGSKFIPPPKRKAPPLKAKKTGVKQN